MDVTAEGKQRYFQETAIALRREGFRIEPSIGGRLGSGGRIILSVR